ncbi:2OG-Fe(II) oxygenase [Komagataeibacter sp. FNDCF1]|uniref:2OG-Fe(II) oxygenase n=1 Tax=Komagataeibacter sp. FNDCF1 TaxID=2878681 RepID=UPI001E3AB5D2|nr:2OG-Fe(II) oxygenase [Komagataeibacter sp. FNDCF1]MCE2563165.1 2OG-Fe(II) oxygenase [Komagataeibacter sp. FNDCF1]
MTLHHVMAGDPAPGFIQHCTTHWGRYSFDMAAGRYNILLFVPGLHTPSAKQALASFRRYGAQGRDGHMQLFVVVADPADRIAHSPADRVPGALFVWDADRLVHGLYGVAPDTCLWVVVDPMMRICLVREDTPDGAGQIYEWTDRQPRHQDGPVPALLLPDILERAFCDSLIAYYRVRTPQRSAILTQGRAGQAVSITDQAFKRRHDCVLNDPYLVQQLQARIIRRVVPQIAKVFQCKVTRMNRMIVSCYDGRENGCFGPHRDNTVAESAHRLFAISINLNDEYEGGELVFPEFSARGFRPPAGGAMVFSCGLLHAVRPVTHGCRYACLPFAFNDGSLARSVTK